MKELDPVLFLNRTLNFWWIIAITMFVGGLLGFAFSYLRPPVYEATAKIYATVDVSKYGDIKITERDEDLALSGIQDALLSNDVLSAVVQESNAQKLNIDWYNLGRDVNIERGNAYWYLRYRNPDRLTAQKLVNLWMEKAYQAVLARLANHTLPDYVIFNPLILAGVPTTPVEYGRNKIVLAGSLLGLIAGIIASNLIAGRVRQ